MPEMLLAVNTDIGCKTKYIKSTIHTKCYIFTCTCPVDGSSVIQNSNNKIPARRSCEQKGNSFHSIKKRLVQSFTTISGSSYAEEGCTNKRSLQFVGTKTFAMRF